ncbi:serine protease [Photobacterium indicum]|uniref:serine protease n=1 Tax=Photobacterium indicum TaxID=81447 RepID=UPI003D0D989A
MHSREALPLLALSPLLLSQLSLADEVSSRIINGTKSDSWPFMVALVSKNRDVNSGQFCGASFLGGRYILTAVHCVNTKEAQDLDAVISISDLTQDDVAEHRYSVKEVYIHSSFQNASSCNNIAILELEKEVDYTPVNLAGKHLRNNLSTGETLTVMGWGDQDPVPLVDQTVCSSTYSTVTENAFCAGFKAGGYDSCQGDSGGPIVVSNGGTYEQLGIVSWGSGCAEAENYGVYANVSYFADWILEKTQGFSYRQSEFVGVSLLGAK